MFRRFLTTGALFAPLALVSVLAGAVAPASAANTTATSTGATHTPFVRRQRPRALRVVAVYPRSSGVISGAADFTVRFSAALATGQRPAPRLAPSLAGKWQQSGPRTLTFHSASAFTPGEHVTLTVPSGIRAADGGVLSSSVLTAYTVGEVSPVRLVQLLAVLGYLPVHLVSAENPHSGDLRAQLHALYSPPAARLVLGRGWPSTLRGLWANQRATVIRGALMDFQLQHGLAMTGVLSTGLWSELLSAVDHREFNHAGYTYALVSQASPETLTIYHNGAVVVRTLANTGIPASPTALGTFPVYERLTSQVMRGVNPNGVPYADYVQWVSYFNGGDAIHYMPRASYGYPQSLGCVELPYAAAQRVWGYLTYGSLVTVT